MLYNKLEKNWKNKFVVQQKNNIRKKLKNVVQHWNFFLNVGQHTKDGHKNSNQNF